jgi:tRNA threonylcarbamoyladenosine biosynthesis protein TsaE
MDPLPLPDTAATDRLGEALAPLLRAGDAVLLEGPLGAGKSALVRALLRTALGDPALEVPSPTFTLVQSYRTPGGLTLHHFDLWRLQDARAAEELGWYELASDGVVLVEWPDRLGSLAPDGALRITLAYSPDGAARTATLSWPDSRLRRVADLLDRKRE